MPEKQPLLTIAVPTYQRAEYLREFLAELLPQLEGVDDVELLISDNCSPDETPAVVQAAVDAGAQLRSVRQTENIGSDANFVFCFREARGRYFWLCGDDDILRPGAIASVMGHLREAEYDFIYLSAEAFSKDWRAEYKGDAYGRQAEIVTSARTLAVMMNVMVTFITGIVSNRERFLQLEAEAPEAFLGTNLTQLSWTLPLLDQHRRSLILWQKWVSGREMNSGGYGLAEVFGERFAKLVHRLMPRHPRVAQVFVNYTLRQWFPETLLQMRTEDAGDRYGLRETGAVLQRNFAGNPRFWLLVWPVLRLPLPLARRWQWVGAKASVLANLCLLPAQTLRKLRGKRAGR